MPNRAFKYTPHTCVMNKRRFDKLHCSTFLWWHRSSAARSVPTREREHGLSRPPDDGIQGDGDSSSEPSSSCWDLSSKFQNRQLPERYSKTLSTIRHFARLAPYPSGLLRRLLRKRKAAPMSVLREQRDEREKQTRGTTRTKSTNLQFAARALKKTPPPWGNTAREIHRECVAASRTSDAHPARRSVSPSAGWQSRFQDQDVNQ